MATVTVCFTLDDKRDLRLKRFLDGLPKGQKSLAIREALEAYIVGQGVTLGDIYQKLQEHDRKMSRLVLGAGIVVQSDDQAVGRFDDEPDDISQTLENLGL